MRHRQRTSRYRHLRVRRRKSQNSRKSRKSCKATTAPPGDTGSEFRRIADLAQPRDSGGRAGAVGPTTATSDTRTVTEACKKPPVPYTVGSPASSPERRQRAKAARRHGQWTDAEIFGFGPADEGEPGSSAGTAEFAGTAEPPKP